MAQTPTKCELAIKIKKAPVGLGRLFRADVANGVLRTWLDPQLAPRSRS